LIFSRRPTSNSEPASAALLALCALTLPQSITSNSAAFMIDGIHQNLPGVMRTIIY